MFSRYGSRFLTTKACSSSLMKEKASDWELGSGHDGQCFPNVGWHELGELQGIN